MVLNSEVAGALSYDAKLPMSKENDSRSKTVSFFTPQFSLRHAPGHMRNLQDDDLKSSYSNALFIKQKCRERCD